MSTSIGIACEDGGHFRAVTRLVDDSLLATFDWLDGVIEHCRSYRGQAADQPWYKYHPADANDIRAVTIDGVRVTRHGRIDGRPLEPEAGMWRDVLLLFCKSEPRPDAVILVRDLDGYPERKRGMEQVRTGLRWPFPIVVAVAEPEVEAWHVCGFEPKDTAERDRLAELTKELSFNPTTSSHRLTSHPNEAATDSKRVLARLCDPGEDRDAEREAACLEHRDLLRARGEQNGVAAFLDEVDKKILPLFGASR